jgi:broad specificity phosphatase PhoE
MRTIEVRRHCYTKKGTSRGKGSHLSTQGVVQARRIGEQIGPFNLVLTSQVPRTLETALAMGFAVDDQLDALGDLSEAVWDEIGHQERWTWDNPFVRFAEFIALEGAVAQMGKRQEEAWRNALESVPVGGAVLVISHGRVIESGLVTCYPNGDFASWGSPFHHGEGIRMTYRQGLFEEVTFRRNAQ